MNFSDIAICVVLALPWLGMIEVVRPYSKNCAVIFAIAGLAPIVILIGMELRWSLPDPLLFIVSCSSLLVFIGGCFFVGLKNFMSEKRAILFWSLSTMVILLAAYLTFAAYVMMDW